MPDPGNELDDDVVCWPVTRLSAAIKAGELSSRELLSAYLRRIERLDPKVNSVVTLEPERAMAEAAHADEQTAHGRSSGPLHGVPCTIKDAIATEGIRSTSGAIELDGYVPSADAVAVARLRAAGAVVFGKTNVPTWAGDMQSYNDLFGTTNNPWDVERSPGGSSGGSAAAVACGFTAFELGTDIGGSIRIPSHLCGVFGMRPSYGVVPQDGYLAGIRRSRSGLDNNVLGPITREAADLRLLLDVLAGAERLSATGWSLSLPEPSGLSLRDYRIGLWLDDPYCPVDAECLRIMREAIERIAGNGGQVVDEHPAVSFEDSFETYWTLLMNSNGLNASDTGLTHAEWLTADDRRGQQRETWQEWFGGGVDVLLCPVLATTAFPHDHTGDYRTRRVLVNDKQRAHDDIARWTGLIGALGLPAATVPIGLTADGFPVGVQVVAPYLRDNEAIRVAGLIAEVAGGYRRPPCY